MSEPKSKRHNLNVRLTQMEHRLLRDLAKRVGTTHSNLVRILVRRAYTKPDVVLEGFHVDPPAIDVADGCAGPVAKAAHGRR